MERMSLLRVGGVCAVSYAIGGAVFLALMIATPGAMDAEGATEVLPVLAEHPIIAATTAWLLVLLPILLIVAGLSFFQALRQVGSMMWIAVAAFVGGAFLIIYRGFVWVAMSYELAPAFVAASEDTKDALAVVGDTLERFAFMADMVGGVLIVGIGVLLFSLAIPHTSVAPRWVARLGVFVAVAGGWFTLLAPVAEVFELINFVGFVAFWVWMVAMGLAVWRVPERG